MSIIPHLQGLAYSSGFKFYEKLVEVYRTTNLFIFESAETFGNPQSELLHSYTSPTDVTEYLHVDCNPGLPCLGLFPN